MRLLRRIVWLFRVIRRGGIDLEAQLEGEVVGKGVWQQELRGALGF